MGIDLSLNMEFIGRFHPLLLHLPIGMLLYVFLHWSYERFFAKKKEPTDFTFAFTLGALSAVASAVSGWILAKDGGYDEGLLNWHKYMGIGTAVGSVLLLLIYKKWPTSRRFTAFFTAMILLLGATGHYGGSLTHGEGFLTTAKKKPASLQIDNIKEAHVFNDIVMPIVERKCVSCHNAQKSKGELLLNSLEGWLAGGENGTVLKAGFSAESPIVSRLFLPKRHEDHMPPAGKLQLTNQERNLLEWWVDSMQTYDHQIKDLTTTAEVDAYLESLQESSRPKADKPTAQQLSSLKEYGMIASLQSIDDPWVAIRLENADSFNVEHLKQLKKIAPAIQSIDVSNSAITDADLKLFSRFENVERINLSSCDIGSGGIAPLKQLAYLRSLNLHGTQVDSTVFKELAGMESLQKLYVWRTPIDGYDLTTWRANSPSLEIIGGVDFEQFGSPQLVPPLIMADQDLFTDSLLVELQTKALKATIRYTLDGSPPSENSPVYTEPFYVYATAEVQSILSMDGWTDSDPSSRTFAKSRFAINNLKANVKPHENYTAGGIATLTDLMKGSNAFGDGNWLGFFGEDLVLTADLGQIEEVSGVTIGTLSDQNSYIHQPLSIKVSISTDGRTFRPFQDKQIPVAEGPTEALVHNHLLRSDLTEARYIRIKIRNQGVNPSWHPAPGATCWLFVDEVLVE
jgi:predicted CXXCH cytochrome family protein